MKHKRMYTLSTHSQLHCSTINPLAAELNIYMLAHHLGKTWIFYEPKKDNIMK